MTPQATLLRLLQRPMISHSLLATTDTNFTLLCYRLYTKGRCLRAMDDQIPLECDMLRHTGLVFVLLIFMVGNGGHLPLLCLAETRPAWLHCPYTLSPGTLEPHSSQHQSLITASRAKSTDTKRLLVGWVSCWDFNSLSTLVVLHKITWQAFSGLDRSKLDCHQG